MPRFYRTSFLARKDTNRIPVTMNVIHFLVLFVALAGFKGWKVRWSLTGPMATFCNGPERGAIRLKDGHWELCDYDDCSYDEPVQCVTRHPSLWNLLTTSVCTRWDQIFYPFTKARRVLLKKRGDFSLSVLLHLLGDNGTWSKHVNEIRTDSGKISRRQTSYWNEAGWAIQHFLDGSISAENVNTRARICYIAAGKLGYWFVESGTRPDWKLDPFEGAKYPHGANTLFMLSAYQGI